MREDMKKLVLTAWKDHRGKVIGTALGLVLGMSVLLFGFWKTAFVLFCGLIGLFIGSRADRGEDLLQMARDFLADGLQRWK